MISFHDRYDATIRALEEQLSDIIDSGQDFEMERNGDVLNLEFEDGARFIISPNSPVEQLWVSANYAGNRFNWSDEVNDWINEKTAEPFRPFLAASISGKLGASISL
ncbi:MAG: iron donor protein CyaY [Candidatus Kapaibacterium sp.]|jgi:iron donor protein CyaY